MDFWQVFPVAIALVFIIEDAAIHQPQAVGEMLVMAGKMDDRTIRNVGMGSMLIGMVILCWLQ